MTRSLAEQAEALLDEVIRRDPIARCVVIESRLRAIEARLQHLDTLAGIPTAEGHR
jgi:hypothetical protein